MMAAYVPASVIQAATVPELWLGCLVIGITCAGAAYITARHLLLAISFAALAAALCWVPAIPAHLVSQVETTFGAHYGLHAAITSALAPIIALSGLLLGRLKKQNMH